MGDCIISCTIHQAWCSGPGGYAQFVPLTSRGGLDLTPPFSLCSISVVSPIGNSRATGVIDTTVAKQLIDKIYEKRKAAALESEKQIRECHQQIDHRRITQIIEQLVDMFSNSPNLLHIRNGGLVDIAGTAIALGMDVASYIEIHRTQNRIRYLSAECLYNIAKVSKGELADSELSVKNGAELPDRILKDIVAETASVYIPQYPETVRIRDLFDSQEQSRIYVPGSFTRSYLASWIAVLDSVEELELLTYLLEFLDGLLKHLSDPTEDVRPSDLRRSDEKLPDITMSHSERARFITKSEFGHDHDGEHSFKDEHKSEDYRGTGASVPGQGVRRDYAAIIEILMTTNVTLRWFAEFLTFLPDVMTPRLIPAILPNLAHHPPSRDASSPESVGDNRPSSSSDKTTMTQRPRSGTMQTTVMESSSRPRSRTSSNSVVGAPPPPPAPAPAPTPPSPATVNELTIQFLSQHEQIRVAALKWRIMLHQKALKQILAMDDGTFPALRQIRPKRYSDLPAQTLSSSEESYFKDFMMDLFELFSTDRKLLEACGSPIIHQSCLSLNTERIYETFAEILEKEEVARLLWSLMQSNVQMLNMILITLPEQFRKRLKGLETRQDGQALFTTLYRSWCHNAIAVFSLCMLAQDYEHASNLLSILDLHLQLLEPERYPYLFKCLYGLLMLLPQSTSFVSLHSRLNGVNSAGFLHIAPKA
ncbi:vacuolar protein 14 C-terminal Fig4p binding-domain-containing protein [Suillus subalutaceus]|uniref:vacuolar protein 14 C-terminal Fig4p binding-domain-containing protein n=1 Tax=Suillus subalutaceus TaxID=48586 RepID=UPI001B86AB64|nr:vacuolar protein 14 C-terminal Fig4p binding-domain-containing protein [Suillus subalutaceus]XP_041238031.1 vacuolar protein 14 C-terminal Fig4p binding-domain-containing protein [Suillus subalutaceus]KAG1838194.1 vacuolar protein 14 C-terminal Fig4p binding-domain-containing protein [Suillus subalutaceus]KAG1838209.1 vacuolar protein 14 C-terminal Fig4p binding-domain-containing protein [Suillus subalutaceus]